MENVSRPTDLDDQDFVKFMKDVRQGFAGKSVGESITYLRKVGSFLENLESLINSNDVCSTIWNPPSKKLLIAQQSYVAYKCKSFQQKDIIKNHSVIQSVISLIVAEQILILQTTPSRTQPVFQRSESDIIVTTDDDDNNKRPKWW